MAAAENQDSWRMLFDRAGGQADVEMHCGSVVHYRGVRHAIFGD